MGGDLLLLADAAPRDPGPIARVSRTEAEWRNEMLRVKPERQA